MTQLNPTDTQSISYTTTCVH